MLQTPRKKSNLLPQNSTYLLPICFVILSVFVGLQFFLLLYLTHRVNILSTRKNTFVQLINGEAIEVAEKDMLYRHPEVIKNIIRKWLSLTFDWNGAILNTQKLDPGYDIGGGKKVTTNAYYGSFLIQSGKSGFRQSALQLISEITPPQIFTGQVRSKIIIQHISPPREITLGVWEVDLISTRLLVHQNGTEDEIDFNKTITIQAVDIPTIPPTSDSSLFEQQIYEIRLAGLEITKIVDYQRR